jgi:hypothetical protein
MRAIAAHITKLTKFFTKQRRQYFLYSLGSQFGGLRMWVWHSDYGFDNKKHSAMGHEIEPKPDTPSFWHNGKSVAQSFELPLTKETVIDEETHTISFQVINEVSDTRGKEAFIEVAIKATVGAELNLKVIKIGAGIEQKTGYKTSRKWEDKQAERRIQTMTKTFVVSELVRDALFFGNHDANGAGALGKDFGYRVGRPVGGKVDFYYPYWSDFGPTYQDFRPNGEKKSSYTKAKQWLDWLIHQEAEDWVRRMPK